jgi:hypothetical protein
VIVRRLAALHQVADGLLTGASRNAPAAWWPKFHAGPARLGQSNGDGLFDGTGAVFPPTDMPNLFPHELTGLGRRRLSLSLRLVDAFHGFSFRHKMVTLLFLIRRS